MPTPKWLPAVTVTLLMTLMVQLPAAAQAPAGKRYLFGIVPQQSSSELARAWVPVLHFLERQTGLTLEFATAKDIPTFEARMAAGQYDFGYLSPYTYTVLRRSASVYEAFAKEKDKKLKGIIVVRKDRPYHSLADLQHQALAFPAPSAIAATLIPLAHFQTQAIPIKPQYVSSHESVYLTVAKGLYAAGGGVQRTFETMPAAVRDKLRVLWTTPGYTPHPFVAHPRVPKEVVEKLRAAMFTMDQDPQGKQLLERIAFKGIAPATDAEYDDIRALKLTISDHLLKR